jgi:hypothetical protein
LPEVVEVVVVMTQKVVEAEVVRVALSLKLRHYSQELTVLKWEEVARVLMIMKTNPVKPVKTPQLLVI